MSHNQAEFPVGSRVGVSALGVRVGVNSSRGGAARRGTVTGYGGYGVLVLWDGNKMRQSYHPDWLTRMADDGDPRGATSAPAEWRALAREGGR